MSSLEAISISPQHFSGARSTKSFGAPATAKVAVADSPAKGDESLSSPRGTIKPVRIAPSAHRNFLDLSQATEQNQSESAQDQQTQQILTQLRVRDREVRAHEQAHAIAGGVYAGAPQYTYQKGPDGVNYAVSGSVDVDVSPVPGDPEATIKKMQIVKKAALAPAQPSAQDLKVAAAASQLAIQARADLVTDTEEPDVSQVFNKDEVEDEVESDGLIDDGVIKDSNGEEDQAKNEKEVDDEEDKPALDEIKPEKKVIQQYLAVYKGITQISATLVAAQAESEKNVVDLNKFVDLIT